MYNVLIVDDEEAIRTSLGFALEDEYQVATAADGAAAVQAVQEKESNLVLLDLKLGQEDGLVVLEAIKAVRPDCIVIIMTAHGSIQSSVEAMRRGAFSYLTKPLNLEELQILLAKAAELAGWQSKAKYWSDKATAASGQDGMIGEAAAMRQVFQQIVKLRNLDTNVLIVGESGTGKELVAKALHYGSLRQAEPFEVVNCAAIPRELLESELFGYEKGAFSGAVQRKKGLLELADGGTLFLDEISEMELRLQAKLLRVVQEKEIMPLGGGKRKKLNVRIVCATNRDLRKMVQEGQFREDLYFRLHVAPLCLPPLRERRSDIPLLVRFFLGKFNRKLGKQIRDLDAEAWQLLNAYPFPGNVRELEHMLEKAMIFADADLLRADDLFPAGEVRQQPALAAPATEAIPIRVGEPLREIEKKVILHNLAYYQGDKAQTAKVLKISERKLWYKLKEYEQETE